MTAGLGGLGYSEDAVAAKLSLDLPNDSEKILANIAASASELRVSMESVARFSGEYMDYIKNFPTFQRQVNDLQREQLDILRNTASTMDGIKSHQGLGFQQQPIGNGVYGLDQSGRVIPIQNPGGIGAGFGNDRVPPGYDRFPGARGGNDTERRNDEMQQEVERQNRIRDRVAERNSAPTGPGGQGHPTPPAPPGGWPDGTDPNRSPGGSGTPSSEETNIAKLIREQLQGGSRGVEDMSRIFTPGASNPARLASLARLMGNAPNAEGEGGSGLAGLLSRLPGATAGSGAGGIGGLVSSLPTWAKGVGIAGAGLAGVAMVNSAVQNVGEGMQSLRAQDLKTHSLGAGLGVESDIRLMALNPLITNEQSREIIMGAMKSGYSGKSYDSAVDFIKGNLIDMNMEVNKSVELLRKNVDLGNQSIASLKLNLENTQGLAANGTKTTEGLQNDFGIINGASMNAGADATDAAAAAQFAGSMFNQKTADGKVNALGQAGQNGEGSPWAIVVKAVMANPGFTSRVGQAFVPNAEHGNVWKAAGDKANQYIWSLISQDAKVNTWTSFGPLMVSYGINFADGPTGPTMRQLYDQAKASKAGDAATDPTVAATKEQAELSKINIGQIGAADFPTFDEWSAMPENAGRTRTDYDTGLNNAGKLDAPELKKIAELNPGAVVKDDKGKAHVFDPNDKEQAIGLANGTWKLVDAGAQFGAEVQSTEGMYQYGEAYKEQYIQDRLNKLDLTNAPDLITGTPLDKTRTMDLNAPNTTTNGGGEITLSPEVKKFFQFLPTPGTVPTDSNTAQSNAGYGGAQTNSAPPGSQPYVGSWGG